MVLLKWVDKDQTWEMVPDLDELDDPDLRIGVKNLIRKWEDVEGLDRTAPTVAGSILAKLFGYENYTSLQMGQELKPEINTKLKMLLGPNGFAIYKAMKARLG